MPSSVLCLSFLVSDKPVETVGNNVSVNRGGHNTSATGLDALTLPLLYCMSSTWVPEI